MAAKTKPKSKSRTTTQEAVETARYLIVDKDGQFVIEVPITWRVTFGWVNPSAHNNTTRDTHCVRIWEGEKLRAVFDSVSRFRDLSIPYARKIQSETGQAKWERDSRGNFSQEEKRQITETVEQEDLEIVFDV